MVLYFHSFLDCFICEGYMGCCLI